MEDYDNDPVLQKFKFPTQKTNSDAKRLAAINEKLEKEKSAKQLIKNALSGKLPNKKIVFDNPVPPPTKKSQKFSQQSKPEQSLKCKQLFDDYDDDGGELDASESFKLNIPDKRFKSSKESKKIELQSRFAHDPRFKIDDKFLEDDDEFPGDWKKAKKGDDDEEQDDLNKETEKEMDILEEVLGKPLKRKFKNSEEKQVSNSIIIPRYDPSKPEAQKFKIRKVDKLEPYQLPDDKEDEPIDKPEVSKERFYEISETFTKDFVEEDQTKGQSFSLSALFGRPVADIPEVNVEIGAAKVKPSKLNDKNSKEAKSSKEKSEPSKKSKVQQESDSQDEDTDNENSSKHKKKSKSKVAEESNKKGKNEKSNDQNSSKKSADSQSKKLKVSNPLLKYERFCFNDDDERLASNSFYNPERIKQHIASWKEKKIIMSTALTKKRRHFKHVSKLKTALESGDARDKDLKLKYRIYKETTKKH